MRAGDLDDSRTPTLLPRSATEPTTDLMPESARREEPTQITWTRRPPPGPGPARPARWPGEIGLLVELSAEALREVVAVLHTEADEAQDHDAQVRRVEIGPDQSLALRDFDPAAQGVELIGLAGPDLVVPVEPGALAEA